MLGIRCERSKLPVLVSYEGCNNKKAAKQARTWADRQHIKLRDVFPVPSLLINHNTCQQTTIIICIT